MTEKPIKVHQPCDNCRSSDALAVYGDHTFCFSCSDYNKLENSSAKAEEKGLTNVDPCSLSSYHGAHESTMGVRGSTLSTLKETQKVSMYKSLVSYRSLTIDTLKTYKVYLESSYETGPPIQISFVYPTGGRKIRQIGVKAFSTDGPMNDAGLFGSDVFSQGSARAITITEGELDAMSVYQMMGSKYPSVSVRSATTAKSDCEKQYKYLNSFERIYICFDNDEQGHKATAAVASLFDPNKVYIVEITGELKDANDYLTKGRAEEFSKLWWNSKKYLPKGIINGYDAIKEILGRKGSASLATYPFPTLNEMTYGIREGEVNLFTALEKVGKTEIMRAIEYHLLKTTDDNIAIIHLEEEEKRSVQGLLSYELDVPVHLPDSGVSLDDQVKAYEKVTKRDGRLHFYTHFGSDDPDTILSVIRYLVVVCKCKFVFLDHITMLVTGYEGDDERRKLDYISTRLAMLTRELKFTLFLVSHVNDNGQTRGSRNIAKIADLIVHLDRDPEADSFDQRNTTALMVKGNRYAARSGPAGFLMFNPVTYQVKQKTVEDSSIVEAQLF